MTEDFISPEQQAYRDRNEEEAQNPFTTMTKAEIVEWLDTNITDVPTRTALKHLGRAFVELWKETK